MSKTNVSVRLIGELPDPEELSRVLGVPIRIGTRRGQIRLGIVSAADIAIVEFSKWGRHEGVEDDNEPVEQLLSDAAILRRMAPVLAAMDRSKVKAELRIGTVRTMDQGGFELPAELVAAAGEAKLSLGVSITVVLDDD